MRSLNDCLRNYPILLLIPVAIYVIEKSFNSEYFNGLLENEAKDRSLFDAGTGGTLSQSHAIICKEDLEHIKEITNADLGKTASQQSMQVMLYRAVTRPIQMACTKLIRMGEHPQFYRLMKRKGSGTFLGCKKRCCKEKAQSSTSAINQ
jgi:hypothetical protein